jgi:hypothetical protein
MSQPFTLTGYKNPPQFRVSHTDLIRFWVIVSITVSIICITYLSMSAGYGTIVPQLFYFPILYTTYFYPDRGMYTACSCAFSYLFVAAFFVIPEPVAVGGIIVQALLFLGIAAGSAYVLKKRDDGVYRVLSDDAKAVQAMISSGESDRVEFKLQSLWSTDLSKEEIFASDSADVRKYRNNASRFIIARSIAGFLNTDGGDLIIGIGENRIKNETRIAGIENDYRKLHEKDRNPDGYRRMIVESIVQKYLPEIYDTASRFIHISFPSVSERTLCRVHITPSDKPIFVDAGNEEFFFIRIDASTRSISGKTLTHYILTRFKSS